MVPSNSTALPVCPQDIGSLTLLAVYTAVICTTKLCLMLGVTRKVKDCWGKGEATAEDV